MFGVNSHSIFLRQEESMLHLEEGLLSWQTTKYLFIVFKSIDCFRYFASQTLNADFVKKKVQNLEECVFQNYEQEKLNFLRKNIFVIKDNFTGSNKEFMLL